MMTTARPLCKYSWLKTKEHLEKVSEKEYVNNKFQVPLAEDRGSSTRQREVACGWPTFHWSQKQQQTQLLLGWPDSTIYI